MIVVVQVFSWSPARLRHVRCGVGRRRSLISSPSASHRWVLGPQISNICLLDGSWHTKNALFSPGPHSTLLADIIHDNNGFDNQTQEYTKSLPKTTLHDCLGMFTPSLFLLISLFLFQALSMLAIFKTLLQPSAGHGTGS